MRRAFLALNRGFATPAMMQNSSKQGRSFDDVRRAIDAMTGGRPDRCPNNLELTRLMLDRLHMQPMLDKLRFVHVAGTKGKGTTSAYAAALLHGYGYKVGLFTSPHLLDVRERVLINNTLLSKDLFARYFFDLMDQIGELGNSESQLDRELGSRANFFRFMFLLSLKIFFEESVDVAVMEVGMGGRIDATNSITPDVSVITALGLDHMEILGETVEEIAGEKAGIMKPGVICYAAPQLDHPSTRDVLQKHGRESQTPVVFIDEHTLPIRNWPHLSIGGKHAVEDSKLALVAARRVAGIPPTTPLDEVERGVLHSMNLAGRSQIVPINGGADATFYLDGAHTVESLRTAVSWFLEASSKATADPEPRRVLVFYSSRKPQFILKALMPFVQRFSKVILAGVRNPRTVKTHVDLDAEDQALQELMALTSGWRDLYREIPSIPCKEPFHSLKEIVDLAVLASDNIREDATKPAQVLVTGSFFLVADIMKLIYDDDEQMTRS